MITDTEEETLDLDWFGVDATREIGHFTTGGRGFLPSSVRASRANLDLLSSFFLEELAPNGTAILASHIRSLWDATTDPFLESFSRMAAKGLYSFDCITLPTRPTDYHMMVRPSQPLRFDELPGEIRRILDLTHYAGKFKTSDVIKEAEVR